MGVYATDEILTTDRPRLCTKEFYPVHIYSYFVPFINFEKEETSHPCSKFWCTYFDPCNTTTIPSIVNDFER